MRADVERDLRKNADEALGAGSSLIEIPAGCGKTELLAAMARRVADSGGKSLVLTHTHAGVDVLRRRLRRFNVPKRSVTLLTIASWSRRLVAHFPRLCGWDLQDVGVEPDWDEVQGAAARGLAADHIAALIDDTYSVALIDEFQDCTIEQGAIVQRIAERIPTVVLGDRLQGIFGFGGSQLFDWFDLGLPTHEVEVQPWRWRERNEDLGDWLLDARVKLLAGDPLDLSSAPLDWIEDDPANLASSIHSVADHCGSVVVVSEHRGQRVAVAKRLRGRFSVMERLEGEAIPKYAAVFDEGDSYASAAELIDYAKGCFIGVPDTFKNKKEALLQHRLPTYRDSGSKSALDALCLFVEAPGPGTLTDAMISIEQLPGVTLVCREAWLDLRRSAIWASETEDGSLISSVQKLRDRIRIVGRRPDSYTVSRTLLAKGLEFDGCVVLGADRLDQRNLYVALSRGRDRLVILSGTPSLHPAANA